MIGFWETCKEAAPCFREMANRSEQSKTEETLYKQKLINEKLGVFSNQIAR